MVSSSTVMVVYFSKYLIFTLNLLIFFRFVVLLASDRLARSSKFLMISASYLLF